MLPETEIGLSTIPAILKDLDNQVQTCIQSGAKLLTGRRPLSENTGNFYLPTILAEIPRAAARQEEFLAP